MALPHRDAVDLPREVQAGRTRTRQDDTNAVAVRPAALGKKNPQKTTNQPEDA